MIVLPIKKEWLDETGVQWDHLMGAAKLFIAKETLDVPDNKESTQVLGSKYSHSRPVRIWQLKIVTIEKCHMSLYYTRYSL